MIKIKLRMINKKNKFIKVPNYATLGSAAMDLQASITNDTIIKPNEVILIGTGISIYIENENYAGIVLPRSGIGHKNGIVLGNLTGLIDSDYQGEIKISCWNRSIHEYVISPGDRIAQLMVIKVNRVKFDIVESFKSTQRSDMGFGHTGR